MMSVLSLDLIHTLQTQRERERSESIEPDDDATCAADGAFRAVSLGEDPVRSRAGYARDTKQLIADTRAIPVLHTVGLLRHPLEFNPNF